MSEIQTAEILTMLKSERKGVRNSDVRAFGATTQPSEIRTGNLPHNTSFECYLLSTFPPPFGGWGVRTEKKCCTYVLCFTTIPFYFSLKSKLQVPCRFFIVPISDRKKGLKSKLSGNGTQLNCLKSKLVRISDTHCIRVNFKKWSSPVL